jgi:hypothetical protein
LRSDLLGGESYHMKGTPELILTFTQTLTGNLIEAATHMSGLQRLAVLRQKDGRPMPFTLAAKIIA